MVRYKNHIAFGPIKIIWKPYKGIALHWRWSITWRWVLSIGRGNWRSKYAKKGFYWHKPNNHWMQCGFNSWLFDVGFVMQDNLKRT